MTPLDSGACVQNECGRCMERSQPALAGRCAQGRVPSWSRLLHQSDSQVEEQPNAAMEQQPSLSVQAASTMLVGQAADEVRHDVQLSGVDQEVGRPGSHEATMSDPSGGGGSAVAVDAEVGGDVADVCMSDGGADAGAPCVAADRADVSVDAADAIMSGGAAAGTAAAVARDDGRGVSGASGSTGLAPSLAGDGGSARNSGVKQVSERRTFAEGFGVQGMRKPPKNLDFECFWHAYPWMRIVMEQQAGWLCSCVGTERELLMSAVPHRHVGAMTSWSFIPMGTGHLMAHVSFTMTRVPQVFTHVSHLMTHCPISFPICPT